MTEPDVTPAAARTGERVRTKLARFSKNRQQGWLRWQEIAGFGASAGLLLVTVIAYFYFLAPARSRRQELQFERERLERRLEDYTQVARHSADTQASIAEIRDSLQRFESQRLTPRSESRAAVIEELNELIRRNNLRISAGASFTPLEALAAGEQPNTTAAGIRSPSEKWRSVFPGISINLTVEGSYPNLRRFIGDVEASKKFIVINAVELESDSKDRAARAEGETAESAGAPVSLRLDLAAYFRRAAETEPVAPAP
jgi:Tfp pilus assembly protein PilO